MLSEVTAIPIFSFVLISTPSYYELNVGFTTWYLYISYVQVLFQSRKYNLSLKAHYS